MTLTEQQEHFNNRANMCSHIMLKKGNDYTSTSDRLDNFKVAGRVAGISPEQNCLSLIATKVARIGSLLHQDRTPDNESINDSIGDLINYGFLLDMLVSEKRAEEVCGVMPNPLDDPF